MRFLRQYPRSRSSARGKGVYNVGADLVLCQVISTGGGGTSVRFGMLLEGAVLSMDTVEVAFTGNRACCSQV